MKSPIRSAIEDYCQNGWKVPIRGDDIANIEHHSLPFVTLHDLIVDNSSVALFEGGPSERSPLSHSKLKSFVSNFSLSEFGLLPRSRVALLLPNGPELAVALMSVMNNYAAFPINPTSTWQEIKHEVGNAMCVALIVLAGASTNDAALEAAKQLDIGVFVLTPHDSVIGLFRLSSLIDVNQQVYRVLHEKSPKVIHRDHDSHLDSHNDIVLMLHTSGTSGNKKLVTYSLDMIVVGVSCIIGSWNLNSQDICLNMMPLFHIGGIMRNVLSPILAGGSVITCNGFDPLLFWDILFLSNGLSTGEAVTNSYCPSFTWYYASPTMHHAILQEAERRKESMSITLPVQSIRFIANAAGGLLPVLAQKLKDTFNATILTSYGMTECMPISSPPQNYDLSPVGTSGTPVGPHVMICDDHYHPAPTGVTGNILIRGYPCFVGYENNPNSNDESFVLIHGKRWFITGDTGYLDKNSYLFISGRSKEIINRGGETISPFEIEEVLHQHPFIQEALAFSAPHETFQETVGAILVCRKNKPRVDLPSLHKFLEGRLHRSKWPQCLIYMTSLPKNATGKILRLKVAERCGLPTLKDEDQSDAVSLLSHLWEGHCPPTGTPLTEPIAVKSISIDLNVSESLVKQHFSSKIKEIWSIQVDLPLKMDAVVSFVDLEISSPRIENAKESLFQELKEFCDERLHAYECPSFVMCFPSSWSSTASRNDVLAQLKVLALQEYGRRSIVKPRSALESQIELIWREQLHASSTISVQDSFFDIGGDSLKAGQLIASLRKKLRIQLSVSDLFTAPTIEQLAIKISTMKTLGSPSTSKSPSYVPNSSKSKSLESNTSFRRSKEGKKIEGPWDDFQWENISPYTNNSWSCMIVQAIPLVVIYPIRRIAMWFCIAIPWVYLMGMGWGRFESLLAAMVIARLLSGLVFPLVTVIFKWILIGRYTAGKYPLWSGMYLKWWLMEQISNILGRGYYRDDIPIIGPSLTRFYYRLMGAKIGRNVRIHKDAKLGQYDLLQFGDDVLIDSAIVRPFGLEEGHFVLLPIVLEDRCTIGVKSVVSPGSHLPSGTCLGPLSSSYEWKQASDPDHKDVNRMAFSSPPLFLIVFLGLPIIGLTWLISLTPWYWGLKFMVSQAKLGGWYQSHIHSVYHAFLWWITPRRLMFYLFLRVIRRCMCPFIYLAMVIIWKKIFIGTFTPVTTEADQNKSWRRFQYWMMSKLLPGGTLGGVSKLVGTHYEAISVIYRLLGAKVGKRVYWPGSGLDIVEYDLLEVGDDVVFGSRSVMLTSTRTRAGCIRLEAGTMVADRCVLGPDVHLRRGSVLGSGSYAPMGLECPLGSVWVGSQEGRPLNVSPTDPTFATKDTLTPFGRAFYQRKAPYFVIPLWMIMMYNITWQAICTCFRNCPTALSLILCNLIIEFDKVEYHPPLFLFQLSILSFIPLHIGLVFVALSIDILGKWILLSRREPGTYSWDYSSYCQRWQLYLTLQEIRRAERHKSGILDMIQGSIYLVYYFRALGATIGENVCLYPNGGDPMMTEPDLVTLGDHCGVDDASLIAHINTRGVFRLNPLEVGAGSVLKSMTRLLSGAAMEKNSMLLEHTLVLAGERVDQGVAWQGWPSSQQIPLTIHRDDISSLLKEAWCLDWMRQHPGMNGGDRNIHAHSNDQDVNSNSANQKGSKYSRIGDIEMGDQRIQRSNSHDGQSYQHSNILSIVPLSRKNDLPINSVRLSPKQQSHHELQQDSLVTTARIHIQSEKTPLLSSDSNHGYHK